MSKRRIILGVAAVVVCACAGVCFAEPVIEVWPSELDFVALEGGSNPVAQTLFISNGGTGKLEWEITEDCTWLSVEPVSGESFGETDEVTVSVDITDLTGGEYSCELLVSAPGAENGTQVVTVFLYVDDEVLEVPSEYPTIQSAIDANTIDMIIVADGVYTGEGNREIDFKGRAITVRSENGPNNCIIDCQDAGRGFYFHNGEGANSVLDGFTITNGYSLYNLACGGGILCYFSSPTIKNCIFTNNLAKDGGGGIGCYARSSAVIKNCTFKNNAASYGGGLYLRSGGSNQVINCKFINNSAVNGGGGGLSCHKNDTTIKNCTFSANSAKYGGGVSCTYLSNCTITNCTFAGNTAISGAGVICLESAHTEMKNCILWDELPNEIIFSESSVVVDYCNVKGQWSGTGNIAVDPMFVDTSSTDPNLWDLHLRPESLCIDAGTNTPEGGLPEMDIEGNPRVVEGDNDGVETVDMGAYEVQEISPEPVIRVSSYEVKFKQIVGSDSPGNETIYIHNGGLGVLNWQIEEDCDWLTVSPESGESTGEEDKVILSAESDGFEIGVYECQLKIISEVAVNSPVLISVVLRIAPDDGNIWVPYEFGTIQSAIDTAVNGDVVIVADGTYYGYGNRDIDFKGKAITVCSANGAENCIIDCEQSGRGFCFISGEDARSILEGFTIENGFSAGHWLGAYGGGVHCYISGPTIRNCEFRNNLALGGGGGGLSCYEFSEPIIEGCEFIRNKTDGRGGGISIFKSYPIISKCVVEGNEADLGGGLFCYYYAKAKITGCTFKTNSARVGGGIYNWYYSTPTITNSILWDDKPEEIKNINEVTHVSYSDVEGGWYGEGNINVDPEFVDEVNGDYHLQWGSPCVDVGDPAFVAEEGEVDIDGEPRVMGGRVDMGADEVGEKQADFTRDGRIGIEDLSVLSGSWDTMEGEGNWYVLSDLFEDGAIDLSDLTAFVEDWLWVADWVIE